MGNNLRRARKAADLSQEQLAEKAAVPQSNISRYELGKPPFVDDALRIAKALHTTVEALWEETLDEDPSGPVVVRDGYDQTAPGAR